MYSQRSNGTTGTAPPSVQKPTNFSAPYKTQDIPLGSMVQVHVTHVASPDLFQVQLNTSEEVLTDLMDNIHARYTNLPEKDLSLKSFAVGQACIALFSADESWYRAKITGLSGANLIEVYFVDYGNTEVVSPTKVKLITPDLLDLPAQALPCCLSDVSPPSGFWPPEQSTQFEDITLDQSFAACFKNIRKEDGIFRIKLFSESGESINQVFGERTGSFYVEEDAGIDIKRKIKMDNSGDNIQVTVKTSKTKSNLNIQSCGDNLQTMNTSNSKSNCEMLIHHGGDNSQSVLDLVVNKSYDVTVMYAESPDKFWCHLAQSEAEVNAMSKRLNDVYHAISDGNRQLLNPKPGDVCVAKFDEDNSWYRACVITADSEDCQVFFLDFGNSEVVPLHNLKVILPEYKNLPGQAIQCMLGNVRPSSGEWSEDALMQFEDLVYEKEMEVKALSKEGVTHIVTLMDSVSGSDLGDKLIQSNHAVSSSVTKSVNPYGDMEINFPSEALVYLSWADNPDSFWIQLADNQTILEDLTDQIQTYCSRDGLCVAEAQPGFPVLAKYSEDESWYRGTILSLRGSKAKVSFVDYGNTDLLPVGTLLKVPPELLSVPAYSLQCRLDKIRPIQSSASWIVDARDFLENFTDDGVICRFLHQDGGKVVVELLKDDLNIEDQLVKAGVARFKQQNTSNGQSQVANIPNSQRLCAGVTEKVYVSHIETVQFFWCQLSQFLSELESLMEKLELVYLEGEGKSMTPEPGLPCAAKFSEDEAWYRAEILSVTQDGVKVFFVDYGNTDTVSSSDVRILNPEFVTLPKLAICCRLDIEDCSSELGDQLNDLVVDKEVDLHVLSVDSDIHTVDILIDSQSVTSELRGSSDKKPAAPPPAMVKFPPPKLPVGDNTVHAYISCVVNPGKLYLQVSGCDDDLEHLSQKLKDYCNAKAEILDVVPGDGCSALFAEDNEWYRAKVVTCQGSEVTVLFIDYGNTATVTKSNLRYVPPEVADIPPFAIECSLDDLAPLDGYDWSKEATEYLESIALDHELICGFLSTGAVIATVDGEELGDKMVDAGFARRLSVPPAPKKYKYPSRPTQEVKAYITHVDPDGTFYVQLLSMEKEIVQFAILMQKEGKGASRLSPHKKLEKGLVCCTQFSTDNNWYRVTIESVKDSSVAVRFVDYGNCDDVQAQALRETTRNMMSTDVQAFPCKLKNLTEWSIDIKNRFNEMTDVVTLNFLSDNLPFEVEAKTKRGKDIAHLLLNPPRPRVYAEAPKPTKDMTACISHVSHDHIVSFQNIENTSTISELSEKIALFPEERVPDKLDSGYACAAKYSEDDSWYRAIVTKTGTKTDVTFVDFGNCDTVSVDSLKELPEEMLDIPPFAVHCKISGMDKWTEAASKLLDTVSEKEMVVSFLSDSSPYLVKVLCEGEDLSRTLLSAEVSTYPCQNVPNQMVLGYISHMEDDGRFYVHWSQHESTLENLSADLQEYYESSESELARNLKIGQPCCAKFSADDAWYRAEVREIIEDTFKVFFSDFGNTETVSAGDVKYMEKKFIQHAPFAFLCKLNESGTWTKKKQEKFELMTEGKTLNIQFVTRASPYMVVVTRSLVDDLNDESVNEDTEGGLDAGDENQVEGDDEDETSGSINENLEADATDSKDDVVATQENSEVSLDELTPEIANSEKTTCDNGVETKLDEIVETNNNVQNKQENEDVDEKAKDESEIDYKVEKLSEGSRISVKFGHVNSPSDFYILPQKFHKQFEELVSELNEVYNGLTEDEEQLSAPVLHQPVAVYCNVAESWQRGRIEDVTSESCKIFYVDYGNVEETELATVRNLRLEFLSLPLQAVECSLAGVESCDSGETWSEEAVEDFVEMTANKNLLVDIIKVGEGGNCLVQIMDMGISLSDKLIELHHGKSATTPICISKKVKRIFSDSQSPAKRIKMADEQQTVVNKLKHLSDDLHPGEKIHATVCHIENPSQFWCHLTFAEDALTSLMEKLQATYRNGDSEKPNPENLSVGDLGVIRSGDSKVHCKEHSDSPENISVSELTDSKLHDQGDSEMPQSERKEDSEKSNLEQTGVPDLEVKRSSDSKFYRAEILMISAEDMMEVRLIDYGRTLSVPTQEFLCLSKDFYHLPSQALCCQLHRVLTPGGGWSEEARSKFTELVSDKELVLVNRKKLQDRLSVDLFDKEDSVAQLLISSGLAVINESESCSEELDDNFEFGIPSIRLNDDSLEESRLGVLDYSPLEPDTDYHLEIETENALPNKFHALVVLKNEYSDLFSAIQCEMEGYKMDGKWSAVAGEPCLVKDEDGYCRGRVVSTSDSSTQVYLVDSGKKIEVQPDCVAPINPDYLKTPARFIRCQLSEISPVDGVWSQEAIDYFREKVKKHSVGYITSLTEYDCYEVCLCNDDQMDTYYLNQQLVELGYATVVKGSQLEIQMQMEDSFLNETDKMAELEASFQSAAILRENSLGDEELDDEVVNGTLNTTGHSFCALDQSVDHTKDVALDFADQCTIDDKQDNIPQEKNENQNEAEDDQKEAEQKTDEDQSEALKYESEASEGQNEASEGQNEASEGQTEASKDQNEASKGQNEASEGRNEASVNQSEAGGDGTEDVENEDVSSMKDAVDESEEDEKTIDMNSQLVCTTDSELPETDGVLESEKSETVIKSEGEPEDNESVSKNKDSPES